MLYMEKKCRRLKDLLTPKIITAIAGIVILAIIAGVLTGIALHRKNDDSPAADTGNLGEMSVLPDTCVKVLCHYVCGHITAYESRDYIGYTEQMLNEIPGCSVDKMTRDEVILIISVDSYCGNHYILKTDENDFLCVFSTDTESNKAPIRLDINAKTLPQEEYKSLVQGIVFNSLEEINIYLEGIET